MTAMTASAPRELTTWMTVKLGTHKTTHDLWDTLTSNGFQINNWAANILEKGCQPLPSEAELDLVNVSVGDLGFKRGATLHKIYDRALGSSIGLDLISVEAAAQLRRQYVDQPHGELLLIAMEPLAFSSGDLCVFRVEHDNHGLRLNCNNGDPNYFFHADDRWVFAQKHQ